VHPAGAVSAPEQVVLEEQRQVRGQVWGEAWAEACEEVRERAGRPEAFSMPAVRQAGAKGLWRE